MRIAYIDKEDVLNGPGIRVSLWTQGCTFHCPGCHNKMLQDFDGGYEMTEDLFDNIVDLVNQPHIEGLSILGGEPLQQPSFGLYCICRAIKEKTGKSIWMWTGYKYEDIKREYMPALTYVDVLVDGMFMEPRKDATLLWRGSDNQRIIDLDGTFSTGQLSVIDQSAFL